MTYDYDSYASEELECAWCGKHHTIDTVCQCACCTHPEQRDAVCAECCPCTGASTDLTPCGVGECPSITRVAGAA